MKVIVITADDRISIEEISGNLLNGIEKLIGDYTAVIGAPMLPQQFCMFVDENGTLKYLPCNRVATMLRMYPLVGTVVIAKTVRNGFEGLSDGELKYLYPVLKGFGLKGEDYE